MKQKKRKQKLWLFLCIALIAASACMVTACGKAVPENFTLAGGELGEGEKRFTFIAVDGEGNEAEFTILTDEEIVGDALLAVGLIEGEEGPYGLYVKTVNGVTADYDADGTYWSFYIDGEYATEGVDATSITAGSTYMFRVEK